MSKKSKASLTRELRKRNIPIPENPTIKNLQHRLDYWESGSGWLIRRVRPARNSPFPELEHKTLYWLPNGRLARQVVKSGEFFSMGRYPIPPEGVAIFDIAFDEEE